MAEGKLFATFHSHETADSAHAAER